MSQIVFITSEKEIDLTSYGIKKITPNDNLYSIFPCLKNKNFIYDFDSFNHTVIYKEFINNLIKHVEKDNNIVFLVCWETNNKETISMFNDNIQNEYFINLNEDDSKLYDLIYRIENNSLLTSSAYSFSID